MSLSKTALKNSLSSLFSAMGGSATDSQFANGIASATVSYLKAGTVTTADAGTVSGGVFAGAGTQSLSDNSTVTPTLCAQGILSACAYMQSHREDEGFDGNAYLAEKIAESMESMAGAIQIKTSVTGTLTPPSGTPSALSGSAEGTVSCEGAPLSQELKSAFSHMWSHREDEGFDGNAYLAEKMSDAVDAFWKAGIVSTHGTGALLGSAGAGSIS